MDKQTVGQRWRARRDIVITVAHQAGISTRMLADVFDLARSRIGGILKADRFGLIARGKRQGPK